MGEKTRYLTTAIAYLNGKPHMGHALEIIQADCLARFYRLRGDDLVFQTGSDEHGIKIYKTAAAQNTDPQSLIDKNWAEFVRMYRLLNISYDRYVRTTDPIHKAGVAKIWRKMVEKGDIYKNYYDGLYCEGCEAYLTQNDLVDGKCPNHPNRDVSIIKEENYFFKLSKYIPQLIDLYEKDVIRIIPNRRKAEILGILRSGMNDISFSRQKEKLPWGIPVPDDPNHVIYVWADALSNYITYVGYASDPAEFARIWPADVHLIGKDITKFHAIYWPAMLISADIPLFKSLFVHGFVMMSGTKMGKSIGNVVDPFLLAEKYGVDPFRFYILKNIPSSDDGNFSEEELIDVHNTSLANDLGNLVLRVLAFLEKDFGSALPPLSELNDHDKEFIAKFDFASKYGEDFENYQIHLAVVRVWEFIKEANKYINDTTPWVLKKEGKLERYATVLYVMVESIRAITIYIEPFIPGVAAKIRHIFNFPQKMSLNEVKFQANRSGPVNKGEVLFPKIELEKKSDPLQIYNFKLGQIIEVSPHPSNDAVYVLKVDLGSRIATICARIVAHYQPDQLLHQQVVVLTNVEPKEIDGIESEGMLVGGTDPSTNHLELARSTGKNGDQLLIGSLEPQADAVVTGKELNKLKMRVQDKKVKIGNAFLQHKSGPVSIDLPDKVVLK
jgi:methionyl-tRNA synthetase